VCHARLLKKLVRVLLGFRLGLGVRDSVGGPVVVVRHRLFNRHLNVPWEQTGLIHLQTLFQLQVGVSAHEALDVAEHYCGHVAHHFPHLPHVLVVDQMVEFWDMLRGEEGVVCQCGFLNTTRFGPDVVLTTLCCHEDGLANLRIIKEAHRKTSRHNRFGPLHVHPIVFMPVTVVVVDTSGRIYDDRTQKKYTVMGTTPLSE
jgi:hypothetical protein